MVNYYKNRSFQRKCEVERRNSSIIGSTGEARGGGRRWWRCSAFTRWNHNKKAAFQQCRPLLWPPTSNINLYLRQDKFSSCPRVTSCNNQATVNMVLVVSNETKLLFIPNKSFYPAQWCDQRGKGFKQRENNLVLFKRDNGLSAKLKCLKNRTTTYASLEKELAEGRIVFTEQYQHGNSIILKKILGKQWRKSPEFSPIKGHDQVWQARYSSCVLNPR